MQLFAPAKINLSFEIKGRRADGFHEIETLMTPISLADRLTIEATAADIESIRKLGYDVEIDVQDDGILHIDDFNWNYGAAARRAVGAGRR